MRLRAVYLKFNQFTKYSHAVIINYLTGSKPPGKCHTGTSLACAASELNPGIGRGLVRMRRGLVRVIPVRVHSGFRTGTKRSYRYEI